MKLDKSAVGCRVKAALQAGYLRGNEPQKFKPKRLVIGDPMLGESGLMPSREQLEELMGCAVAGDAQGYTSPPQKKIALKIGNIITNRESL